MVAQFEFLRVRVQTKLSGEPEDLFIPILQVLDRVGGRHQPAELGRVFASAVLTEEDLESRPDLFLALDLDGLKIFGLELGEEGNHAVSVIAGA